MTVKTIFTGHPVYGVKFVAVKPDLVLKHRTGFRTVRSRATGNLADGFSPALAPEVSEAS
jgi:hypothetical protein